MKLKSITLLALSFAAQYCIAMEKQPQITVIFKNKTDRLKVIYALRSTNVHCYDPLFIPAGGKYEQVFSFTPTSKTDPRRGAMFAYNMDNNNFGLYLTTADYATSHFKVKGAINSPFVLLTASFTQGTTYKKGDMVTSDVTFDAIDAVGFNDNDTFIFTFGKEPGKEMGFKYIPAKK